MYHEHLYRMHAVLAKGAKIKSAKTFLKVFPQKFIPTKYPLYGSQIHTYYCITSSVLFMSTAEG